MPSPLYDGRDWFYNEQTGQIQHIHGDAVAGVATNPEWYYFAGNSDEIRFKTQLQAEAYKRAHPAKKGAGPLSGIPGLGNTVGNLPSAASAVGSLNPLGGLFQSNIWLRVVEVGLGVVLIVVGLVKLAPPSVKSAAKVAALL